MSDEQEPNEVSPVQLVPPIKIKRDGKYCSHRHKLICENRRAITCEDCGAPLDPFDVLFKMARHRENLMFEERHQRAEIGRLKAELVELNREARNLKAVIRRRKVKEAPPEIPSNVVQLKAGK